MAKGGGVAIHMGLGKKHKFLNDRSFEDEGKA
jgi:hypothetical protein